MGLRHRFFSLLFHFALDLVFEQYQKARLTFVQSVADLATRPQNIETLQNAGVMALLRPLLLDVVPSVQQTAALALGRLANYSDHLAEAVVRGDILPQLVYSLAEQNVNLRSFACPNSIRFFPSSSDSTKKQPLLFYVPWPNTRLSWLNPSSIVVHWMR